MKKYTIVTIIFFAIVLLTFQNCSKRKFALTDLAAMNSMCAKNAQYSEECFNLGNERLTKDLANVPTDILFVLDESCSMDTIANSVRDGFNSIVGSQFPVNTKMAVTYMAPSNVNSDNSIDFSTSFIGLLTNKSYNAIKTLPGNMKLVTNDSIENFKNTRYTVGSSGEAFKYDFTEEDFKRYFPDVNYGANNTNGLAFLPMNASRPKAFVRLKYDPAHPMSDRTYNSSPNADEGMAAYELSFLTKRGCTNGWFDPKETNTDGVPCLSAAVQLAPLCTGVEAGLVSLEHLIKKYKKDGKKLFRDNAIVNIIFVSDTHEAGLSSADAYFGQTGAPARMRTLEEIQAIIQDSNPTISSIKFSGILPLPEVGNPLLQDLKTIGTLAPTAAEAQVGTEDPNGYSYLPIIKGSRGVAAHASNSNWSGIAEEIVKDAKYTGNILVTLQSTAAKIFEVKINGEAYDLNKVVLNADRKSFTIQMGSSAAKTINIEVRYEKTVDTFVF